MNELPREARWSLLAAISIGLFLGGLGLGGIVGGRSVSAGPAAAPTSSSTEPPGPVRAVGGQSDGIVAVTDNALAAAVRAQNGAANGVAIWGTNAGPGVGVYGIAVGSDLGNAPAIGVAGQVNSTNGVGVYGTAPTLGQAGYFAGSATVTRDLQVDGAIVGYTAIRAINGSSVKLYRGNPVSLMSVRSLADGSVVLVIGPAQVGQQVVGIADRRAKTNTIQVPTTWMDSYGHWFSGASSADAMVADDWVMAPEDGLLVVMAGQFPSVTANAGQGPIVVGTALVVDPTLPGELVAAAASPAAGTVVGYALGGLASGVGAVPMVVMIH
jgi:hypothetical protein